jgi:hypothetical protein
MTSPATKTQHKDMLTLEPCNSRQGNMGADMDKVLEHIERIQDLGVCS